MHGSPVNIVKPMARFIYLVVLQLFILTISSVYGGAAASDRLPRGFSATPDPSVASFQPLLTDSTQIFSLGFLRVNKTQLALAVLHIPSSEPLWLATTTTPLARWAKPTSLSFNGSLVLSDPHTGVFWSTKTNGDRVFISNSSNIQVQNLDSSNTVQSIAWQSFDFPQNTLVENQNFTSNMSLVSSNGLYSMKLGDRYIGLYAEFNPNSDQIYYKRKALEAKADIVQGQGPIYIRVSSDGFLGMYQTGSTPVDIESFNSYQRSIPGIRILRIEPDGNLNGYYYNGSTWIQDYTAIKEQCELPNPCGSYGLCRPGSGCSCLDNRTEYTSSGECMPTESGDFCGGAGVEKDDTKYWVLRKVGVELPFKDLMWYNETNSFEQCESTCKLDCACWGALYNNGSGFCYLVNYPIRTLVAIDDDTKFGYFRFRETVISGGRNVGFEVGFSLLGGAVLVFILVVGFGSYRVWKRNKVSRRFNGYGDDESGISPLPYKDLGSASFRSIELPNNR